MAHGAADTTVRVPVMLEAPAEAVELVADRLFAAGASAVAETTRAGGPVTVTADIEVSQLERISAELDDAGSMLSELGASGLRVLEPDGAWNHRWREFAVAWRCGDRVVLRPEWVAATPRSFAADGSSAGAFVPPPTVEVLIEPGEAFGSGSHVTTRLCVEQVGRLVAGGERVLDVGCGTGVLGVAAALLGARSVVAVDIDPEAVRVTRLVAALNGVSDRVHTSQTPVAQVVGEFELVLANLLLPIIEQLGADLAPRVAPGGSLIASGVLVEQQTRVASTLAPLVLDRVAAADGWVAMVFHRPHVS